MSGGKVVELNCHRILPSILSRCSLHILLASFNQAILLNAGGVCSPGRAQLARALFTAPGGRGGTREDSPGEGETRRGGRHGEGSPQGPLRRGELARCASSRRGWEFRNVGHPVVRRNGPPLANGHATKMVRPCQDPNFEGED